MIFETFQHMCIAAIGMLESERETKLDFTNQNGVEFGISIRKYRYEFSFGIFIGCEETGYFEQCFYHDGRWLSEQPPEIHPGLLV